MPFFRLISERTVEENILKKANQKRMLGDMAIEGGNFTTAFFKQVLALLLRIHFYITRNYWGILLGQAIYHSHLYLFKNDKLITFFVCLGERWVWFVFRVQINVLCHLK